MAITTRLAPMYGGQKIFAALLCAIFGVWGAYDYWVKIPEQERVAVAYEQTKARKDELDARISGLLNQGMVPSLEEQAEYIAATETLKSLSPGGAAPVKPSKFNRVTQLVYIACLPLAPWFFVLYLKAKRQRYTLDDDDTLHFAGDKEHQSGAWRREEIADIDMSRWMAKSIAYAIHADGRRLLLDAYVHKNLHLIVGAIASRKYPDQWDGEAKIVKSTDVNADLHAADEDEPVEHNAAM